MTLTEEARRVALEAEDDVRIGAILEGWEVHRVGWPDFLLVADGRTIAVEVKSGNGRLTKEQHEVMGVLALSGIDCYVYHPTKGLVVYRKGTKPKASKAYATRIVPMERYSEAFSQGVMAEHERVTGRVLTARQARKEKDVRPRVG